MSNLGGLSAAPATGTYDRKRAALACVPLLITDDCGLEPLGAPADDDLHSLIATRYGRADTTVTSKLDFNAWTGAFAVDRLVASATIGRLHHNARGAELDGLSYRDPQVPPVSKNTLKTIRQAAKQQR